jgi:acyl carrier protein
MEMEFITAFKDALEIEDHEVELDDEFRQYAEWDSLNRLSLIAMLDEEYDIQIEDKEFQQLKTIQNLIDAVKKAQ